MAYYSISSSPIWTCVLKKTAHIKQNSNWKQLIKFSSIKNLNPYNEFYNHF